MAAADLVGFFCYFPEKFGGFYMDRATNLFLPSLDYSQIVNFEVTYMSES